MFKTGNFQLYSLAYRLVRLVALVIFSVSKPGEGNQSHGGSVCGCRFLE